MSELLDDLGHTQLMIGGGLTADVQVNDTHAHKPYNNHYRSLELSENAAHGLIRPKKLPSATRQTVMNRSASSWSLVDHSKCVQGYLDNGITNALDGTQDGKMRKDIWELWQELEMTPLRKIAIAEVEAAVRSGQITDFHKQYREVLEDYDPHEPIREGLEGAPVKKVPEEGDLGYRTSDDEEIEQDWDELAEDTADSHPTAGSQPTAGSEPTACPQPTTQVEGSEDEKAAAAELLQECDGQKLQTCREVIKLLENAGMNQARDSMAEELNRLLKKNRSLSNSSVVKLRQSTRKRKAAQMAAQQKAAEEDAELQRLTKMQKLAEMQLQTKKEAGKQQRLAWKQEIEEIKAKKASVQEAKAALTKTLEDLRTTAASQIFKKQLEFMRSSVCAASTASNGPAITRHQHLHGLAANLIRKKPWKRDIDVPVFWPFRGRVGRILITVREGDKPIPAKDQLWASKAFSWDLFGWKKQERQGKTHLESRVKLLMPGYSQVVAPRWSIDETLGECHNDVDMAWLTMVWRYTSIMGSEYPCGLREWPPH